MRQMSRNARIYMRLRSLLIPEGPDGDFARAKLYAPYLRQCGKGLRVYTNAFIYDPNVLSVGDYVCIGFGAYVGNGRAIFLDDGATLGPYSMISASTRTRKRGSFRTGAVEFAPVSIGKGTQVAAHACITAGVSIGNGCLVAAGSVVTKSFGDNLLIAGIPARVIREYVDDEAAVYTY